MASKALHKYLAKLDTDEQPTIHDMLAALNDHFAWNLEQQSAVLVLLHTRWLETGGEDWIKLCNELVRSKETLGALEAVCAQVIASEGEPEAFESAMTVLKTFMTTVIRVRSKKITLEESQAMASIIVHGRAGSQLVAFDLVKKGFVEKYGGRPDSHRLWVVTSEGVAVLDKEYPGAVEAMRKANDG